MLPLDLAPHGEGRLAITRRVPLGPIAAITPFTLTFTGSSAVGRDMKARAGHTRVVLIKLLVINVQERA